jgi:hypothetical protein
MSRIKTVYLHLGLLALTALAYLPVWRNEFVDYDDDAYVTANPNVVDGLSWSSVSWAFTNQEVPYWIPLTWVSLQFDAHFFSTQNSAGEVILSPQACHGQNLFWHTASCLLLFAILLQLTGRRWCSFLAAALFAIHPMHVESVAWAFERKDVLSVFFGLLAVRAYVAYVEVPGRLRSLGTAAAFGLSLMSKPMLITLPFVLLLLDYWPLRRLWPCESSLPANPSRGGRPASLRQLVLEKGLLFGLSLVFALATLLSRFEHGALVSLDTISAPARVANGLTGYGWYLSHTFYPAELAILYPHPCENWSVGPTVAGAGALLSLTTLALWQAKQRPWLLVGWLWFVVCLAPVIGFAQGGAQAWADRFCYWPHIGLFLAAVWGLGEFVQRARIHRFMIAGVVLMLLTILGGLTWSQIGYWRNTGTLWEHDLAVTSDNVRGHEHMSIYLRNHGYLREAELHLAESNRLKFSHTNSPVGSALRRSVSLPDDQIPSTSLDTGEPAKTPTTGG